MSIVSRPPKPQPAETPTVDAFIQGAPDSSKPTGRGIKKGKKEQVSVILDPLLLDKADNAAAEMGMSRSAFISMCLSKELKNSG